jgi:hypothetical protein
VELIEENESFEVFLDRIHGAIFGRNKWKVLEI